MLNVEQIQAGNVTATQIEAAYEPINEAADEFEYLIIDFCEKIFEFAGIDDIPTFKRSQMKNQTEETQMILTAANYLDEDTIVEKLPFLSNDEVEIVKRKKASEDVERFREQPEQLKEQPEGEE
jgi:enoyl reductase-like protein